MKVYTCDDHDTHWPVGGASIVIAEGIKQARAILDKALMGRGLKPSTEEEYTLTEIDIAKKRAIILCDGNY